MVDLVMVGGYLAFMLRVGWKARGVSPDSYWVAERRYGTMTSGIFDPEEAGLKVADKINAIPYIPSDMKAIRYILKNLDIDFERYLFFDIGCGLGRIMLLASDYPFSKIVGIELSEQHCMVADQNIEIYNSKNVRSQKSAIALQR